MCQSLNVNTEEGLEHGSESMVLDILKHRPPSSGEELQPPQLCSLFRWPEDAVLHHANLWSVWLKKRETIVPKAEQRK
jgi:hypothetical protein